MIVGVNLVQRRQLDKSSHTFAAACRQLQVHRSGLEDSWIKAEDTLSCLVLQSKCSDFEGI